MLSQSDVVNCFQIVFLLGSLTTGQILITGKWCCELLSNCIFTGFFDNIGYFFVKYILVVNCFQIVFLLGSLTTWAEKACLNAMLWIAFKLYFYWVLWQRRWEKEKAGGCCELLSNCIFTGFFDNIFADSAQPKGVVNCFQIVFLLGSLTTRRNLQWIGQLLWIAFKLYFYWVLWQHLILF